MNSYDNFTEAYIDLCRMIRDESDFEVSPRDLKIKEKLGVQFRIRNPRDRLPYVKARNFSLSYFVAESIWYMSGNNSTDWISRYASFWKTISDDGKTANSAYGSRMFKAHPSIANGEIIQWDYVRDELKRDPDSRRAVIHIRTPDDSIHAVKDVPCTLALQFFIRNSSLHLHVNMRSSDIILGIAYDIPAFTLMQEILANELGIDVGEYCHTSNSLHCYERDFKMLDDIARSNPNLGRPMLHLPKEFPIESLVTAEEEVWDTSKGSFLDGIVGSSSMNDIESSSSQFISDWRNILCSARARKLKDNNLGLRFIYSTNYNGYHFFKR